MVKKTEPTEIADEALDKTTGGWGRSMYHSCSEGQSASYATRSSDPSAATKPGGTTHANITLGEGGGG